MIRVLVNGAQGKMGSETVLAVKNEQGMSLVGEADHGDNLEKLIREKKADVVVDFTRPDAVKKNTLAILKAGAHPVVGTTGLSEVDLREIADFAAEKKKGTIVCPNFAIGAVLMMKFAAEAAKYMPSVEIIELHHDQKVDAPSGTALKTAEMIAASNPSINGQLERTELLLSKGARGALKSKVPIHSVRLKGLVAHQEVVFGGLGQTLTLRHDTINRQSFMPGVIIAIRKVVNLKKMIYGLENIL